jgi:hypothetical protein
MLFHITIERFLFFVSIPMIYMSRNNSNRDKKHWVTAPELPYIVFEAWKKPHKALNPVAIVATVDPDGKPHTAPFGSLRAITPRLLRLLTWRRHDTFRNICLNSTIMVSLLAPPDIAVSVGGRAAIVRKHLQTDSAYAVVEVHIETVKNDMVSRVIIESPLRISVPHSHAQWFETVLGEMESI